jgi:fructokinase
MTSVHAWLARDALPGRRVVREEPLIGGYRNDNTLLVTDDGDRYVLRRYLDGAACAVEVALAWRLDGVVPVAPVVAADPDGTAAGQPVLLSRFMPGEPVNTLLPGLAADDAGDLGDAIGAVLAAIGTISFPGPGFLGPDLTPTPPEGMELPTFLTATLARRHPGHGLTDEDCERLVALGRRYSALLVPVAGARQLVHSDFNPKNLLAVRRPSGWDVTAVLDWEFAFSGSPLFDVGNMTRFAEDYPPSYVGGFVRGFRRAGGHLPPNWRETSRTLDLYALADLLAGPPSAVSRRAAWRLRRLITPPAGRPGRSAGVGR